MRKNDISKDSFVLSDCTKVPNTLQSQVFMRKSGVTVKSLDGYFVSVSTFVYFYCGFFSF